MGTQLPLSKKGAKPPQFSAHVYCGQTAGWVKMALGTEVGVGPRHIVLDGDPAPLPQKRTELPIFGHFYCGQAAECIKMPLGVEVRRGPGHIVLDGDTAVPIFGRCLLWPNGWMDQDATWYGGRPRPRRHCVRLGPSFPIPKRAMPPIFGPCLLWPNGCMYQDTT